MNDSLEISLYLGNIMELLRAPGIRNRKRYISSDAEEFIVEEAEALSHKGTININIHMTLAEKKYQEEIAPAIHNHFCHRKIQSKLRLKESLHHGFRMLLLALLLLAVIFSVTEISFRLIPDNDLVTFIRESFIILGWVALWRPLDLLLYDWYPVKRKMGLFRRLEKSNVQVIIEDDNLIINQICKQ